MEDTPRDSKDSEAIDKPEAKEDTSRVMQTTRESSETRNDVAPKQINVPGVLILQWLTYAFWGWTILALVWLSALAVNFTLSGESYDYGDTAIAYSIAAVLVLFIISVLCDIFYARKEPQHKVGAAMVIMIIHTVIFALCGIAALIVAVFSMVNLMISTPSSYGSGSVGVKTALITGILIAIVYGMTLLRTLRPKWLKKVPLMYWIFMAVFTIVMMSISIFGPAAAASLTKSDRLIEQNLGSVSDAINSYARQHNELPASLDDVKDDLRGTASELMDQNLVEYQPGKAIQTTPLSSGVSGDNTLKNTSTYIKTTVEPAFSYKLCVTYAAKDRSGYDSYSYEDMDDQPRTSPRTSGHSAGRVCYDLQTRYTRSYDY